jgi:Tfp pilus assembly protein PilF
MKTYSNLSQAVLAAATIIVFVSAAAFAGHGGGDGGGGGAHHGAYRGGGGDGGDDGSGDDGGGYSGGGGSDVGYVLGDGDNHGGGDVTSWSATEGVVMLGSADGHTPSFSSPHSNFNPPQPNPPPSPWSHNAAHSGGNDHSNASNRTNDTSNANHGHRPDWYHGNWRDRDSQFWHRWPAGWWATVLADFSALWSSGYLAYDNPYCTDPAVADGATIDYSQPIVLTTAPAAQQGDVESQWPVSTPTEPADQETQSLDAARNAFAQGDYAAALIQCDKAIAKTPNHTLPHEFRALALFALQRYKEAAAALYAVVSIGPGWDWTTMSSFYTDMNVYTQQLRALEQYVKANPSAADARFVLAYQYLTCMHAAAAATQFKAIVQLNPKDQLSAQVLGTLVSTDAPQQRATVAVAPPKPVDAAKLVGNWKANRTDGKAIVMNLSNGGKYTWTFAQKDKPQAFSGDYLVANNFLVLKQDGVPVMVGRVTPTTADRFQFKLPGNNPGDPGLTFGK